MVLDSWPQAPLRDSIVKPGNSYLNSQKYLLESGRHVPHLCNVSRFCNFIYSLLKRAEKGPRATLHFLNGLATFLEYMFYGQKKVTDYDYQILFAEKIHFHTYFLIINAL